MRAARATAARSRRSGTTTRGPIRSSSRSTPRQPRNGLPRAPSLRIRLLACSAQPASCRPGSSSMAAKELVEYVAKSLVDQPDQVTVEEVRDRDGVVLERHVAEDDMGTVIGRNGSVAKALRTLLKVTAARDGEPVSLEIV